MKKDVERIVFASLAIFTVLAVFFGASAVRGDFLRAEEAANAAALHVEETTAPERKLIDLGEFKVTAYCACEICCERWAKCRPTDENGETVVYTANMSVAKRGVTIAADTSLFPFGTKLILLGNEYTVQDTGEAVKGKCIDVYFDSHEEANEFGIKYINVYTYEKEIKK